MKALVMGLGLHGGGLESARFLYRRGAELAVTDLRGEEALAPSIALLEAERGPGAATIRYVLGRHEAADFEKADIVIKNPGVRPDSPFLKAARRVETDISLFLAASPARLAAVTGSKGKSCASSALHWALARAWEKAAQKAAQEAGGGASPAGAAQGAAQKAAPRRAFLGGNITVSPLAFLDGLRETDDVVLELSSWQLGDLRGRRRADGSPLLKPRAAALTAILPDHQDFYGGMEPYVADKRVIYEGQDGRDAMVAWDDEWGMSFLRGSRAASLVCSASPLPEGSSGGWLEGPDAPGMARLSGRFGDGSFSGGAAFELVPPSPLVPGWHQKRNLLAAGLALLALGLDPESAMEGLGSFPGIEHRMELFHKAGGIDFYNDSAATIPEAAAAALETLGADGRLVLVTGGTDKDLDFSPLARSARGAKAVALLCGSGSDKLRRLLDEAGVAYLGPFDSADAAAAAAIKAAEPGDRVALSPGCSSFGMFLNEFDRGRKWKDAVRRLA